MAFIAGFLLSGKKCKRLYGHDYNTNFCVYGVDIVLLLIIGALLGSQGIMVKLFLKINYCLFIVYSIRYTGTAGVNWIQNLETY